MEVGLRATEATVGLMLTKTSSTLVLWLMSNEREWHVAGESRVVPKKKTVATELVKENDVF
jgi:hypothetical protein